jgi:hypothetical protein
MYYDIMEERCVPVENVTAVVFLLILYRYQLQFGGAKGPPSTFPLMKAWTSDATLSSGHVCSDVSQVLSGQGTDPTSLLRRSEGVVKSM